MADPATVFFRNAAYDRQLVRTLAAAMVQAADLGEVFATARRVRKLDGGSWHAAWSRAAERARGAADEARKSSDRPTTRRALLRASEYYRQAAYFIRADLGDARLQDAYRGHVETFAAAARLMEHPAEPVRIPYEKTTLGGYLFAPDRTGAARPTVIFPCGYDSTAEAGWINVPPALERGYNVLVFEGPGQGEALFKQGLFLRPDFEQVLTPVLDWLLARPEVDAARTAIIGRSFAGYLAPRGAAFDKRLAALVCDPAQPDLGLRVPRGLAGKLAARAARAQTKLSGARAEFFRARMTAHGIKTGADVSVDSLERYFGELRRFTLLAHAGQIACPTLIVEAERDFAGGGGAALRAALTAPVELVSLTEEQGAGGHGAGLGQEVWAAAVYGWLHRTLFAEKRRLPTPPPA